MPSFIYLARNVTGESISPRQSRSVASIRCARNHLYMRPVEPHEAAKMALADPFDCRLFDPGTRVVVAHQARLHLSAAHTLKCNSLVLVAHEYEDNNSRDHIYRFTWFISG